MQGFNMGRYVPPDQEGLTSGNKLHNKHGLGSRARNLAKGGGLIVRFEMPFSVWCTTCKPHETLIGQGVRFNAEKKKVGNYYSTPIYSFRMKHTQCGGAIEIRTDPKNTAYVVTEGGRKRDTGEGDVQVPGEIVGIGARGKGEEEGKDPFARLEGKVEDKRVGDEAQRRIWELRARQDRDWEDPYEMSRRLRRRFRGERKALEVKEEKKEALRDKMSLGIELVDEVEEDSVRAGMVDFGADPDGEVSRAARVRPMFESRSSSSTPAAGPGRVAKGRNGKRTADLLAQRKESLRNKLAGNTRAVVDPFLNNGDAWQTGIKRRKTANKLVSMDKDDTPTFDNGGSVAGDTSLPVDTPTPAQKPAALVAYDSDSE